jgi:hypothetical protein
MMVGGERGYEKVVVVGLSLHEQEAEDGEDAKRKMWHGVQVAGPELRDGYAKEAEEGGSY